MGPVFVIWLSLIASLNAQYFDPELFEKDGKGEVSEPSKRPKAPPNLLLQHDDPTDKDSQSVIHTPISNAASKAKEDSTTFHRGIKRRHGVVMERWDGIDGYDIKTLTDSARFPTLPNYFSYINDFVEPDNWGDSFGSRLRAYFAAPQTGNYRFWLASDAQGQLYISTDENPERKVMIAEVSLDHTTLRNEFDKYREQESQPVYLKKGHYYYMEVLHKDQFLDDHANVKVQLPDNTTYAPMPWKFLWTLPPPKNVTKPVDDPFVLVKVAARAGAHAGAQLGTKEAAEKGALAGAIEGEKAGMKAGAAAGAIAARKAATAIATKALAEAIKNMTLNRHVFNIYTGNSSVATASATAGAEGAASAGAGGTAGGSAGGQGGGKGGGRKRPGSTAGSEGGATGGGTGAAKTVIKPKSGQNPQEAARENIDMNGAVRRVVVGAMYIIHSLNIPATQEFKKNLCWRSTYGDIILGRRCQVFIAREGFISRDDGQQTVAWESACVRGYYIMQKNYHYVLAKLGSSKKFYVDATFTAFRTLKFPEAFMFALLRNGWFICESRDANFHITDLVARYNQASISWIQRCSFVIRLMEKWESPMMNCFDILRSFKTTEQPAITAAVATASVPVITTPPPTPAPAPVPPAAMKKEYMICLRIIFINDAGIPYRLVSNLKPQGYYVYGKVFELKYVLPKAPNGSTATKPDTGNENVVNEEFDRKKNKIEKDGRKRVVGSERTIRSIGDKMNTAHKHKQLVSKSKRHAKGHRRKIVRKMGEAILNKAGSRRSAVPVFQVTSNNKSQRFKGSSHSEFSKQTKLNPKELATAEKVLNEIGQPSSVNGSPKANPQKKTNVEQVLNEISQHPAPHREQSTIFEEFPQPRNLIGNALTKIVFTSLDPSQKFDILLNGKRILSVIVDEYCYAPVQVVVHVSKVPKPTLAPPTTKPTTPRPTTQPPPPPIPLPPEPPPPLPPPPPPIPITHPTTPPTTLPTTPPPPPVTAAPPPIPPPPVQPPPPPLPPPPPPVPPPPPTVIVVPVPEGCMHTHEGNSNGKCCKFPFTHRGVQESKCIRGERNFRWCSTTSNYDKDKQWGFCPHCNVASGGTAGGDCCHFPFLFKGKVYQQCVKDSNGKPWCATTYSYDRDQKWGYCGGPAIAKPPPPIHPRPQEIDCPPACSMICFPSCPPKCCRRSSKATIITPSDMQTGVNHCTDHCKKSCAPSCPVKCCPLTQDGCPPGCATSCKPSCPSKCCLTVLTPIELGKEGAESCPADCSESCKPNCPMKCCPSKAAPCPSDCATNCGPECPSKCCVTVLTPMHGSASHETCPSECAESCTPGCPTRCCPSESQSCPQQCATKCTPECPSKCCLTVLSPNEPKATAGECPPICVQSCKPECPMKCCSASEVICPKDCHPASCKPDCPLNCCLTVLSPANQDSSQDCPAICSTKCAPNCPVKCCTVQGSCPEECTPVNCKPSCPVKCCKNVATICPADCSPSNCRPECPSNCCLTILSPANQDSPGDSCPAICSTKCTPNCPVKCCPTQGSCPEGCSPGNCKPICPVKCCENKVTNCPADCSPSNCRPECPSNCCFSIIDTISVSYGSPDECSESCIAECKPECPVKCCKEKKSEDSKVVVCPVSCATKCEPDCPVMCCKNQNTIGQTLPVTCPETCATNCLPSCPPKCCVIQNGANNEDVCLSSCMTKCSPECPQRCCSNALQVPTKPTPAPCPAPCLLACQPSCPMECCLAAFTSQPHELKPTEATLKCPTECYTNCTPSCPVKCCSIVVTYDKKNVIEKKLANKIHKKHRKD